MSKRMIGVASTVLLGTAGVAVSRMHDSAAQNSAAQEAAPQETAVPGANRRIEPLTPEGRAIFARRDSLTAAAMAALDAGRYDEAVAAARQSQSVRFDSGRNQEIVAHALFAQGKDQEALQAYQAIADRGGVHPRNLLPYALLLLKAGQWGQTVAAYNKQLPYLTDGDLMQAHSHFSPDVPRPRELEAAIHAGLGMTYSGTAIWGRKLLNDQAVAHFREALALEPDSPLVNYYYGLGLRRMGRKAEAQAAFAKAAELGGDDVKAAVAWVSP